MNNKYIGVDKRKDCKYWRMRIRIQNGNRIEIIDFHTAEEAAFAYNYANCILKKKGKLNVLKAIPKDSKFIEKVVKDHIKIKQVEIIKLRIKKAEQQLKELYELEANLSESI